VLGAVGADEEVVGSPQARGERAEALRVAVREFLRLDALRMGRIRHGLPMLVGAGEEEHRLLALAAVAREHVGGDRRVRVPQMGSRVDVVDRRGHVEGGHRPPRLLAGGAGPSGRP